MPACHRTANSLTTSTSFTEDPMKTQSNPFEGHLRRHHTPSVPTASHANQSSRSFRSSTRLRLFCAAAMVSAALLISACGGGGDTNSSPGTSGSSTSSAPGVQVLSDSAGKSFAVSSAIDSVSGPTSLFWLKACPLASIKTAFQSTPARPSLLTAQRRT